MNRCVIREKKSYPTPPPLLKLVKIILRWSSTQNSDFFREKSQFPKSPVLESLTASFFHLETSFNMNLQRKWVKNGAFYSEHGTLFS